MRLLAQREHSRHELAGKLAGRSGDSQAVAVLLDYLQEIGLLSDSRFAAAYIRSHAARFGAQRLRQELRLRGVADDVLERALAEELAPEVSEFGDELERARDVWQKKFGVAPADGREWARQARFLQARGFEVGLLKKLLKEVS